MAVTVQVLGTVAVRRDGLDVPLSPQRRLLLALLAARAPLPVSGEQLVDQLWEGRPPRSASTALRVHVTHLRKSLHTDIHSGITYGAGQYALDLAEGALDIHQLERAARGTAEAVAARRFDQATALGLAAPLDGGEPYGPWRHHPAIEADATRLDDLHRGLVRDLTTALLASGRGGDGVTLIGPLAAANPYDEAVAATMIAAMAGAGRSSEALRVAHHTRTVLAEDIGAVPGELLCAVEAAVLDGTDPLELLLPAVLSVPAPAALPTAPPLFVHPLRDERFAGREDLLASAQSLLEAGSGVVAVSGEAGIGKSAFAVRAAELTGRHVLHTSCYADEHTPLEPFRRLVRESDVQDALLREWIDGRLEHGDGEAERFPVIVDRLVAHLGSKSADSPLLLFVDDVHWADEATLGCCRRLLDEQVVPLMLAWRDPPRPAPATGALLDVIAATVPTVFVPLGPLDRAAAAALIDDPDRVGELHAAAGGNPYLLRVLADMPPGAAGSADDRAARMSTALRRLLEGVPNSCRAFLEAAAECGPTFALSTLVGAGLMSDEQALSGLDDAIDRGLIVADPAALDRWAFRHALLREELQRELPPGRRASIHRSLAAALDPDDPHTARERAAHLVAARAVVAPEELAEAVGRAVAAAIAAGSPDEADALLRAVEEPPGPPVAAAHCALARGRLDAIGSSAADARHRLARAISAAAAARRADLVAAAAAEYLGPWTRRWDVDETAIAVLEDARGIVADLGGGVPLARVDAALARARYFGPVRSIAVDLADGALHAARESGDVEVTLEAMRTVLLVTSGPVGAHRRRALAEEALVLARDRWMYPQIIGDVANARLAVGDVPGTRSLIHEMETHGELWSSPFSIWLAAVLQGALAIGQGDEAALATATECSRTSGQQAGADVAESTADTQGFVMLWWSSGLTGLSGLLGDLAVGAPAPVWRAGHALACIADGDRATAADLLPGVVRELDCQPDYLWMAAAVLAARCALLLGDRESAEALVPLLDSCDAVLAIFGTATAVLGPVDRWRAELAETLGRTRQVDELRRRAHDIAEQTGFSAWAPGGRPLP